MGEALGLLSLSHFVRGRSQVGSRPIWFSVFWRITLQSLQSVINHGNGTPPDL